MDSGQQIIGSIQRWSHNFYKLNLHVASPLAGYAHRDKSFMTLMVENKLPYNLVDCLIYYRKRFLFVEDILAGNRQTIKVNLTKLKKKEDFGEHQVDSIIRRFDGNGSDAYLRKTQRNLTPELLLEIHNKYHSATRQHDSDRMDAGRPDTTAIQPGPSTGCRHYHDQLGTSSGDNLMKFYFLTDESEKSLAPFFSKRVLETVMAGVVIVGVFLIIFWSRRPLIRINCSR